MNWKSRNLEAIIIKTVVKTASAERGEYKDECFVFGAVIDNEFKMYAIHTRRLVTKTLRPIGRSAMS